jgi:hypothetical protein
VSRLTNLSPDELDRVASELMLGAERSSIFAAIQLALTARHLRRLAIQKRKTLSKDPNHAD